MYRLHFQNTQTSFTGRDSVTVIGRDAGCTLRLNAAGLSDRHAAIERRADGFYLRDLGSATGSRINGQPVTEQRLTSGDEIELGAVRAQFEVLHLPPAQRRAFDPLQLLAGVAVVGLVAGQIVLFGWIFSQEHPRRGRTDIVKGSKQQAKQAAPPVNDTPPVLAPLPATESPAAPPSPVLNRKIWITRVDGNRIQLKAQVGESRLDTAQVGVSVQCADGVRWLPVPNDWENFTSHAFNAPCAPQNVRTYYRKVLQDEWTSR
jgi:pSer/pThr/pTyr-binding forkhead associated (FHA) protein